MEYVITREDLEELLNDTDICDSCATRIVTELDKPDGIVMIAPYTFPIEPEERDEDVWGYYFDDDGPEEEENATDLS